MRIDEEFIDYDKNSDFEFFSSVTDMAEELINEAKKDPKKVYNLNITTYLGGHALGFCIIENKYHFFDSNSGWFRFDNETDFISWFAYYYKQRGYLSYHFNEYAISSYSLSTKLTNDDEKKEDKPWTFGDVVIITLLSPILAVLMLGILFNMFVVRGFQYLGIVINEYFNSTDEPLEPEDLEVVNDVTLLESLPKSLEGLDLAATLAKEEKVVQSTNVVDYLDLAVSDTNLKGLRSPSFFKEFRSNKAETDVVENTPQCRM